MPEAGGGVSSQGESSGIPGLLPRPSHPALVQPRTECKLAAYQQRGIPKDISDEEKHTQDFKGLSYTKLTAHQEKAITAPALHPNSVLQFTQYSQNKDSQCYNLVN